MKYFVATIFLTLSIAVAGGFVWISQADSIPSNTYQADHFTIQLPQDLKAHNHPSDDGSNAVVFETGDGSEGFEVFSQPFTDALTTQGIQQQYPYNTIDDFGLLAVGGEPAFTFVNDNNDSGGTFEVWFVHDGLLYQVLTYRALDPWLKDILATWKFR